MTEMLISCSTSSKKQANSGLSGSSFTKTSNRKTGQSSGGEVKGIKKPNEAGTHSVFNGGKFDKYGICPNYMYYKLCQKHL
jgi:hypothetical protein